MISKLYEEIIENIHKAEEECYLEGIDANAIILNKNHTKVKEFYISICARNSGFRSIRKIPPMILGKKLFLGPLPDDFDFALTEVQTNDELDAKEIMELLKKYVQIKNKQLIFKNISYKKNKRDFYKILSLLDLDNGEEYE